MVEKLKTGSSPAAIAVAGGSVWAAADAPQAAHRGGTLRVLVAARAAGLAIPMDWLHWQAYTTWATFQLSSLAYDGLVAYRRVEGAAGATLVGALATTAPAPSRDGRTYVFTLRPGLRFSDGRPVRPTDFRASMERFLQVTRGRPQAEQFPTFYAGIVGARRCMAGKAPLRPLARDRDRCAGAHDHHPPDPPDADFLHKLTMAFAFVVPADSPAAPRRAGRRPAPGPTASPPGTRSAAGRSSATATSEPSPARSRGPASRTASRSACTT